MKKYKIISYSFEDNKFDDQNINEVYSIGESRKIINRIWDNNGYAERYPEDYTEYQLSDLKEEIFSTLHRKYKIANISYPNENFENIDLGSSFSFVEAVSIVKNMRKNNLKAELYPEEYSIPLIKEDEAYLIALEEYNKIKYLNPDNYGELNRGGSTFIYYSFYCRDYEKEAQGMTPGYYSISIDKLDGHKLSSDEIKNYSKLNYSF